MIHRELKAFACEDRRLTWRLLIGTCAACATCVIFIATASSFWLAVCGAIVLGLLRVRLMMFFHDYMHKAILKGSLLGGALMKVVGVSMLMSPSLWLEWHREHHWHAGQLDVSALTGGFPLMTLDAWRTATPLQRLDYRISRHPLLIVFAYFTLFGFGFNIQPLWQTPWKRRRSVGVLVLHFASLGCVVAAFGWLHALCLVVVPLIVAHAVLGYMFFVQHNFPGIDLRSGDEWSHDNAALHASSFFDMSPLMHWLTGNLGYHHAHHMNHRIPFYKLPAAMAAVPALQNPIRTTWHPRDMWACLRLSVWDTTSARMLSYAELDDL